jgi:hypothetical protein
VFKVVQEESEPNKHTPAAVGGSLLDELAREGARQMLAAALQAEVAAYIEAHREVVDEQGRRLGSATATTSRGRSPRPPGRCRCGRRGYDKRTDEATGERQRFSSAILPAWTRKSPGVAEVPPLLYLHGLSSGDFVPALEQFLGSAAGLSASTVTRLRRSGKTTPGRSASGR